MAPCLILFYLFTITFAPAYIYAAYPPPITLTAPPATYEKPRARTAARSSTLGCPGAFWANRALKPMTLRTLSNVDAWIRSVWVETSQLTPSLQGGVVREPEYLFPRHQVSKQYS